jgi:hypothetical protein
MRAYGGSGGVTSLIPDLAKMGMSNELYGTATVPEQEMNY